MENLLMTITRIVARRCLEGFDRTIDFSERPCDRRR